MSRNLALFVVCLGLALPQRALAQPTVDVNIQPGPGGDLAMAMGVNLQDLELQLETQATAAFGLVDTTKYLQGLADVQAFSTKGLATDYGSNFDWFMVGFGGNISLGVGENGFADPQSLGAAPGADTPITGIAPNLGLVLGLNLGLLGLDGLIVYANFFQIGFELDQLEGEFFNAGGHLQYRLFAPEGDLMEILFQWAGLTFTTGYINSTMKLRLADNLSTTLPLEGPAAAVDAELNSTGSFTITSSSSQIPFEVSTGIRLLYIVSIYAGVGVDVQFGTTEMEIGLNGNLTATNPQDQSNLDLGAIDVTATEDTSPSTGKVRFMAGMVFNVWFLKVFLQLNLQPDAAVSLALGGRIAL